MTRLEAKPLTAARRDQLERIEGIIFDIQRYSLHDGPGLRTNVFFKGCPLRCQWCANPESQQLPPELALLAHNCINCGQFEPPCPLCWPGNREIEDEFRVRAQLCPTGAIQWIGRRCTAGEIFREVRRDAPFYEDGGGLTLTGGEATMQPDLAEALLRLAKAECISTALETCGHTQWTVLARLLPYLDTVLYDLKHVDSDLHRRFTGLGNDLILANLRRLAARQTPVIVRVPLIPGFNASIDDIRAIAEFILGLNGSVKGVDLLPYHRLGQAKYKGLGRDYLWADHKRLTDDEVQTRVRVVESYGLPVSIGG